MAAKIRRAGQIEINRAPDGLEQFREGTVNTSGHTDGMRNMNRPTVAAPIDPAWTHALECGHLLNPL